MVNEKRLIDANDVLDRLAIEASYRATEYPVVSATLKATMMLVDSSPTVDAVEVVLCKDCKHLECGYKCYRALGAILSDRSYMLVDDEDFCSYGERRTD